MIEYHDSWTYKGSMGVAMSAENLQELLLEKKRTLTKEYWYDSLNGRKKDELEFHNKDRDKDIVKALPQDTYEMLHGNKKYYKTTEISNKYVRNWIETEAKGKVFLDYACGNGSNALRAAKAGASLSIGIDISDVSIENATGEAKAQNLTKAIFLQGDCENTGLPNDSVDTIICSGMLHHLDLSYAFPELRRILKPGGKILAVEALDYNPIIKLYRTITPSMRTDWEKKHILSLKDITFAKRFFNVQNINYWHITSYFCAFVHKQKTLSSILLKMTNAMDSILTKIPLIQLLSWQFTFELVKKKGD